MHYDAIDNAHGLPNDPFKAIVAPRPIGWVSSMARNGVPNLAPYSFFNAIAEKPHYVVIGSSDMKDSLTNIEATSEFVVNLATWDLREQMNATSARLPAETDEMRLAGLTPGPSRLVKPPRVAESPAHLECRHWKTIELPSNDPDEPNASIFGEVIGIHIRDDLIVNGRVDITLAKPIARLGYSEYAVVEKSFQMRRPA